MKQIETLELCFASLKFSFLDAADEVLGRRAFVVPRALGGSGPAAVVYDESEEEAEEEAEDPNKKRFDSNFSFDVNLRL